MTEGNLRILFLDTQTSNPNHYLYLSAAAALRRHPEVEDVIVADYGNALALAKERRANFFLAFDGQGLKTEICRRLRQRCGFAAVWLTDDPYELRYNTQSAEVFDIVFTNDKAAVREYGEKGRFLPFGADPATHRLPVLVEDDPKLRYDIFFAGVAWPNRVRFLRSLVRDLPGARFKIALPSNEHLPEFALPFPASAYAFRTSPRDFARLANASRLTLGLHRDFAASVGGYTLTTSPPPRLFEVALAGSLQLVSEEMRDASDFFEPGSEIATYAAYHECLVAIRSLLDDPARRIAMARAAQERALRDHTYDRRIAELLHACATVRRSPSPKPVPSERPRILLVAHNVLGTAPHGGIEIYLDQIRRALSRDFEVLTFSYARAQEDNTFVLLDSWGEQIDKIVFDGAWQRFSLSNPIKEITFAELLLRHRIELIHYHHLIGHPLSLPIIGRALGVPSVWTLHDYDGVCDSFNLLDYEQRYCDIQARSEGVCDFCTRRRVGAPAGSQRARRALLERSLCAVDRICVNGEVTRSMYARFYPKAMAAARVVTLPVPMSESETWGAGEGVSVKRFSDGADVPLELVVLGNFTVEKGANVLLDAALALVDERVHFRLHGRVDASLKTRLAAMRLPNVEACGPYAPEDVRRILRDADATLHLSIWPETFCIALSEAWAAGCVPIVSDIGALGERVTDRLNGFKVRPNDPGDLVRVIRELLASRSAIAQIAGNIDARLWPAAREHVRGLTDMYRELLESEPFEASSGEPAIARTKLTLFDCGIALSDRMLDIGNARQDATSVLSAKPSLPGRTGDATRRFVSVDAWPMLDGEPRLHGHLDQVDSVNADTLESIIKHEDQTLSIRGWRVDRSAGRALGRLSVLLVNESEGVAYAVEATSERRPDIAELYESDALSYAGFQCCAQLDGLQPGEYRIVLEDGGRISSVTGPTIHLRASLKIEDAFADIETIGTHLHASIHEINGSPIDVEPVPVWGRLAFNGSIAGRDNGAGRMLWLVIESAIDGERRYARIPRPEGDGEEHTFGTELDVGSVPSGLYRLSLATIDGNTMAVSPPLAGITLGKTR